MATLVEIAAVSGSHDVVGANEIRIYPAPLVGVLAPNGKIRFRNQTKDRTYEVEETVREPITGRIAEGPRTLIIQPGAEYPGEDKYVEAGGSVLQLGMDRWYKLLKDRAATEAEKRGAGDGKPPSWWDEWWWVVALTALLAGLAVAGFLLLRARSPSPLAPGPSPPIGAPAPNPPAAVNVEVNAAPSTGEKVASAAKAAAARVAEAGRSAVERVKEAAR